MMKELEDGNVQPWGASVMFNVILDVLNQIHRNRNHCQSPNHSHQGPDPHLEVATVRSQVLVGNPGFLWNKECWGQNHRLKRQSCQWAKDRFFLKAVTMVGRRNVARLTSMYSLMKSSLGISDPVSSTMSSQRSSQARWNGPKTPTSRGCSLCVV